jgi:hypothetical protein
MPSGVGTALNEEHWLITWHCLEINSSTDTDKTFLDKHTYMTSGSVNASDKFTYSDLIYTGCSQNLNSFFNKLLSILLHVISYREALLSTLLHAISYRVALLSTLLHAISYRGALLSTLLHAISYSGALLSTLLHATVYVFTQFAERTGTDGK